MVIGDESLHQCLLGDKTGQIIVLVAIVRDFDALLARSGKGLGETVQKDEAESNGAETVLHPAEVILATTLQSLLRYHQANRNIFSFFLRRTNVI